MRADAHLILIETVVSDEPARPTDNKWTRFGKWLDMLMLVLVGAQERTTGQHRALLQDGGFELEKIVETGSLSSLLIARPRQP
jgi:hypothetical protein